MPSGKKLNRGAGQAREVQNLKAEQLPKFKPTCRRAGIRGIEDAKCEMIPAAW
jgi:hypothetical protein